MPFVQHKDEDKIKGAIQKRLYAQALQIVEKENDYKDYKFYSDDESRELFELDPLDEKIKGNDFKAKTEEFKERVKNGESLDSLLVEAFALVSVAANKLLGLNPFKVQMMGAIAIHEGNIAEMKTGEGKTLTAVLPAYLNALTGKGVHIVTVNEYLASREADGDIGRLFKALGLSVGLNLREKDSSKKRIAYYSDILYTTNNEIGFDYLRDNMAVKKENQVQRELNFAIVDEVDSILIDEARTPLIISGRPKETENRYKEADDFVKTLTDEDYEIDIKTKIVNITDSGIKKAETYFNIENLYDGAENLERLHCIENALKARHVMEKGVDYVVREGQVIIVDQFTGRLMFGRQFTEGLHQALEAKEGVEVKKETTTLATITFQNFFRMYNKLSGMTGTAKTEEEEFLSIYNMRVVEIPTNAPIARIDANDKLFVTSEDKFQALIREIQLRHEFGQPILIGTISVDTSELVSKLLQKAGFNKSQYSVLNAKHQEKEAHIIEKAGRYGAITIATNMAGRGTDIKLQKDSEPNEKGEIFDVTSLNEKKEAKVKGLKEELDAIQKQYDEVFEIKSQLLKKKIFSVKLEKEKEKQEKIKVKKERELLKTLSDDEKRAKRESDKKERLALSMKKPEGIEHLKRSYENVVSLHSEYNALLKQKNVDQKVLKKTESTLLDELRKLYEKIELALSIYTARYKIKEREYNEYNNLGSVAGLAVLGTERHESRRIDNQLRGRSGRQGDPGYSCFFISAEDDLLRRFGSERFKMLIERTLILQGGSAEDSLDFSMFSSSILRAQKQIEGNNFDMRKTVLQYDEVMRKQREVIYSQRQEIITTDDVEGLEKILFRIVDEVLTMIVDQAPSTEKADYIDRDELYNLLAQKYLPKELINKDKLDDTRENVVTYVTNLAHFCLQSKKNAILSKFPTTPFNNHYKEVMLHNVDINWMNHIDAMAGLRQSVSMSSYAQQNPLRVYQMEGFEMFNEMSLNIKRDIVKQAIFGPVRVEVQQTMKGFGTNRSDEGDKRPNPALKPKSQKPGRNDPCWCGSGIKYKKCHELEDIKTKKWDQ